MAKTHRGKGLWLQPARGRGTCPICNATRVKVLYQRSAPDGAVVKVCKRCRRKPFPAGETIAAGQVVRALEMA